MNKIGIKNWDELKDRAPAHALVADVDLVIVRFDDTVTVLYGRCAHRGALMADGYVDGDNLICGLHGWDYGLDTGVSEYNNSETLPKFNAWVEDGQGLRRRRRDCRLGQTTSSAVSTWCLPGGLPGPDR